MQPKTTGKRIAEPTEASIERERSYELHEQALAADGWRGRHS